MPLAIKDAMAVTPEKLTDSKSNLKSKSCDKSNYHGFLRNHTNILSTVYRMVQTSYMTSGARRPTDPCDTAPAAEMIQIKRGVS